MVQVLNIAIGVTAVVIAALATTVSLQVTRYTRLWLGRFAALGAVLVILGVVGQQVFPGDDAIRRFGEKIASQERPGPWDAGISLPGGLHITPVCGLGLLIFGLALTALLALPPRPPLPHPYAKLTSDHEHWDLMDSV